MRYTLGVVVFLVGAGSAVAAPQRFNYRLSAYPVAAAACNQIAAVLGGRFAAATGLTVDVSYCDAAHEDGTADLRFAYQAEAPVAALSTTASPWTVDSMGGYATKAACDAALAGESAVFTAHTGKAPVFAYCYRDERTDTAPWVLRLDAFGEAAEKPYFAGVYLFGAPLGYSAASFDQAVVEGLNARGLDARFAVARGLGGYSQVAVSYYGGSEIHLTAQRYAELRSESQCREQLDGLQAALVAAGSAPLFTFCAQQFTGTVEAQALDLGSVSDPGLAIERFASYEDCTAARAGLVAYYRDTLHRPVVGGLCTQPGEGDGRWTVALIETP